MSIRLDKYVSAYLPCTRSEAKKLIGYGKVSVDGRVVRDPEFKLNEGEAEVIVSGKKVGIVPKGLYYMLNKPKGVITAKSDPKHKTVTDLFPPEIAKHIFPVGRLDIDTEGLLILTDDGELCHRLESPGKHVSKIYQATCVGKLAEDAEKRFAEGIEFKEYTSKPAILTIFSTKEAENGNFEYKVSVELAEGKFHQVKKMLHATGADVTELKRVSIGGVKLDEDLKTGEYRELTEEELKLLRQ